MAKKISVALELDTSNYTRNLRDAENQTKGFSTNSTNAINGLKGAFQALAGAVAIKEIISLGDDFTNLNNRLKAVTTTNQETAAAMALVRDVANSTRSDVGAVGDLFTNLSVATADMGLNMNAVAGITKTFSQTLKISGADAGASAGAIRQFGQALASGVLRGDEFNSIMEANPVFMRQVAAAIGEPIGALREMAAEGALTADIIVAATQEMAGTMDDQFGTTVPTVAESMVVLKNEAIALFGAIEERTGIFNGLATAIRFAADNVDIIAQAMAAAFAVAVAGRIVAMAQGVMQFVTALRAAAVAGTVLQGVTGVGLLKVGAGLAAATASIAVMNEMFAEQDGLIQGIDAGIEGVTEAETTLANNRAEGHEQRTAAQLYEQRLLDEAAEKAAKEAEKEAKRAEKEEERAAKKAERDAERAAKEEEREAEKEARRQERHQKEMLRAQEVLAQAEAKMEADLADINATVEKIGLSDTQIKQLEVTNDLNREREEKLAEIARYNISDAEKNELQAQLNALYDEQIAKQREAIAVTDEQQQRFTSGWKQAWAEYKQDAEDNSKRAKELFVTFSGQMEDAFVDFVMTGKANFRDLVKDMIKQLMKIVAKKIFVKIIDLLTGGLGSLFAGFFDKGGTIGAGKFGIVGERGPEIVTGPAKVIGRRETADLLSDAQGMGGGTVVYNINAVDARSFKQLVAEDPEFIYNVSVAGARRLPR
jgi:lambda family phage tail tape measure protein